MREIHVSQVTQVVKNLSIRANVELGDGVLQTLQEALTLEESLTGKEIIACLLENAQVARRESVPICQDTGLAVVFVEMGQDVHVVGGSLQEAIHEGVRQGYRDGYLRMSTCEQLTGKNIGDNTPAIIHFDVVPGDRFKIDFVPKGGGGENMSRVTVLIPSDGIRGIKDFVVKRVKESGAKPCPPIIVGVGIGGTIEKAALLAKKALLRPLGEKNSDPELQEIERELLEEINRLGIGPQGLGGRITALAIHINAMPHHIASIPVAVNIQCHAARHLGIEL